MNKLMFLIALMFLIFSFAKNDATACVGDCAMEQAICIAECEGEEPCTSNCLHAFGRCVSRCD